MSLARNSELLLILTALSTLPIAACNSGPTTIKPPSISASGAASAAMKQYDTNGDGFLSADELEKAPSLKEALGTLDTDKDGKISYDEIEARIKVWQGTQIGVMLVKCQVKLNGTPLQGAMVQFEPEDFMGGAILAGDGETDEFGFCSPRIPKEKRPYKDMPGGLQTGFYRIRVSKMVNGKESIPAKYNTDTTLGQQIAIDDEVLRSQRFVLNLTTK